MVPTNEIESDSAEKQEPDKSNNDILENVLASMAFQGAIKTVQAYKRPLTVLRLSELLLQFPQCKL